jgi:hypothetical protein
VVVARRELAEPGEHLVQGHGPLVGGQRERRNATQGHRREHAERADADAGRAEQVGVLIGRAGDDGPVGEHQFQAGRLGGDAAEARAGAVGAG